MCYAYPGPRCSPHARELLRRAEKAFDDAVGSDKYRAMNKLAAAQLKYDATPEGQQVLRDRIASEGDPTGALQLRLDRGIEDRATALALIKSKDVGDPGVDGHQDALEYRKVIATLNKDPNKDPGLYIDSIAPLEDFRKAAVEGLIDVRMHDDPSVPYAILNYSKLAQYTKAWNEVTVNARGLIVDVRTGEIIARPFTKFFNDGEEVPNGYNDFPRAGRVIATDKQDGSLGIGYRLPDGTYSIATRGSMGSEQAIHATQLYVEKYAGKWDGEKDPNTTYLFEIIAPQHRIVLDYGGMNDLVLIGAVDKRTGRSIPFDQIDGGWTGPRTEIMPFDSYSDALLTPVPDNKEGFVLHFVDSDKRVKLKGETYMRLHRVMTNATPIRLWEKMSDNGVETPKLVQEWISGVPDEFADSLRTKEKEIRAKRNALVASIQSQADAIAKQAAAEGADRKRLAELVFKESNLPHPHAVMGLLTNPHSRKLQKWFWDQVRPTADDTF